MTRETSIALRVGVPVAAGLLLVAGTLIVTNEPDRPKPPVEPTIVCVMPEAPIDREAPDVPPPRAFQITPVVAPVAKPMPGPDVWAKLEVCLKDLDKVWGEKMAPITVAQVRHWVEVEKDPVWFEKGFWWLPLSGEGEPSFPSGIYISVPLHSTTCGGAIIN
jgi:hypothetical protein